MIDEPDLLRGYDPFAEDVIADPYPWYRMLLAEGGAHRSAARDVWVLSRYDDVREAARSHESLSSAEGVAYQRIPLPMMLTSDQPGHTRLRRMVSRDFTPRAVARWEPVVRTLVDEAVDRMLDLGSFDLVEELAGPLPISVIAEVLGIPTADRDRFRRWSDAIVEGFRLTERIDAQSDAVSTVIAGVSELYAYLADAFAARAAQPRDDLLSRLMELEGGERLGEVELFWFCLLLLVAGNETTTNLIGNTVLALFEHPDQWVRLREEPGAVAATVEESLRFGSPVQGFFRTARQPYAVGETTIPEGDRVLLLFAAANRDPAHYRDPDRFDVSRNPVDHLAFGSAIHACLGSHLARLEMATVLDVLRARVRDLLPDGPVVRTRNPMLRGVALLPVRLVPA